MMITSLGLCYLLHYRDHFFLDEIKGMTLLGKYLITLTIMFVGFLFLFVPETDSVEINNKLNLILIQHKNLFCKSRYITKNIKHLIDI